MRLQGVVYTETLTSGAEQTILTLKTSSGSKRGAVFYLSSASISGTAKVYYVRPDGVEELLQEQVIASGGVTALDFDFPIPEAVLKFTPVSSTSTVVKAEGFTY